MDLERGRRWVEEMIINGGNQTKAAAAIGHKRGEAAKKAGFRYAADPVCKEMLREARDRALREAMLTANETVASLARDLKFDPAKLYYTEGKKKGQMKPIWEMDEPTRRALRGIEFDASGKPRVKFPEYTAAREQAMKHFGLYERDNKQKPFYTPPTLVIRGVAGKGK